MKGHWLISTSDEETKKALRAINPQTIFGKMTCLNRMGHAEFLSVSRTTEIDLLCLREFYVSLRLQYETYFSEDRSGALPEYRDFRPGKHKLSEDDLRELRRKRRILARVRPKPLVYRDLPKTAAV